jgi:hypothetical protein
LAIRREIVTMMTMTTATVTTTMSAVRTTTKTKTTRKMTMIDPCQHGQLKKVERRTVMMTTNGRRGWTMSARASGGVSKSSLDEGYNCVVREDGVLVAEDIPSGTYEVSAWWAGARNDGQGNAPRCDSEKQRGCEVRCELTPDGELVCEGIESGTYTVVNVKDLDEACTVSPSGDTIDCTGDAAPPAVDTGDLNLKDKNQHGTRLGG